MENVTERAQMLLMAALGMAILFVALALILNTAIYTENLATRGSEAAGATDASRFVDSTQAGVSGVLTRVNQYNNSSHDSLQQNLTVAVDEWNNVSQTQSFHRGRSVDVSVTGTENGTRIAQRDPSRGFVNVSDEPDWTLVQDVDGTRDFQIYASNSGGVLDQYDDEPFNVTVANGTDEWRLSVAENQTDSTIDVEIRSTTGVDVTCPSGRVTTWIDVTGSSIDGIDCEGYTFAEEIEPPYNISFYQGDKIEGNYTIVVDNASVATNPDAHFQADASDGDPFVAPAVYSANLSVTYQTSRLYFNTDVRIAPGENSD